MDGQFGAYRRAGHRHQFQSSRGRVGIAPGPTGRSGFAQHQGGGIHLGNSQQMKPDNETHHIHQGIYRPQLFQFQGFRSFPVHPALRLPQDI